MRIRELTEDNETQTGRQQTTREAPSPVECTQHESEDKVPSSQVAPTKLRERKWRAAVEDMVPSSQVAPTKLRERKRRAAVAPTKAVEQADARTHARDRQGSRRPLAFTPPRYWRGKQEKRV